MILSLFGSLVISLINRIANIPLIKSNIWMLSWIWAVFLLSNICIHLSLFSLIICWPIFRDAICKSLHWLKSPAKLPQPSVDQSTLVTLPKWGMKWGQWAAEVNTCPHIRPSLRNPDSLHSLWSSPKVATTYSLCFFIFLQIKMEIEGSF